MAIAALMLCFAEGIATQLGSLSAKHLGPFFCVKDDLQALVRTVSTVKAVLLDAEEQQAQSHAITLWLENMTDAFYDADDLLDDLSTEVQLREANEVCVYLFFSKLADCVEMGPQIQPLLRHANKVCASVCLFFPKLADGVVDSVVMSPKIKALRKRFDTVADDRQKFHFKEHPVDTRVGNRERDTYYFVPDQEQVIGREDDKKAVIELLTDSNIEEKHVSILSIVGIGGLGKTTLAQLLFNDNKIQNNFEVKMWVCVSLDFAVKKIVEKMIESATQEKPKPAELGTLITELRKVIEGKKYFLVLDDVWEENCNKLDELEKVLRCGAIGSRVLVTTRNLTVANTIRSVVSYSLEGLDEEGAWSLFKQKAFKNGEEPESLRIKEIGKEIVKKCRGVPLLIGTIGRSLYSSSETEWSSFEKQFAEKKEETVETLKLSYNCLPPHLKYCFAYCSIFPKDFVIKKSMLINLWIAQGFIKSTGQNQSLEDIAHDYFIELLWKSFFQEPQTDKFGDIANCKMHDFMHDLAVNVSGSSVTTFDPKNKLLHQSKIPQVAIRHVAIGDIDFLSEACTLFSEASTTRTLVFHSVSGCLSLTESILNAIFSNLKLLRTLDLHDKELDVVPSSVSKLKHLRYLDFSKNPRIKKLPDSITRLQNLHTLRLSGCFGLEELPRDIKKLINLRHLENDGCFDLTCMPRGLGQLTNLTTLSWFVVNSGGGVSGNSGGLDELKRLNSLRGKLEIRGLVHGKEVASEYKAANLKDKQHLHTLKLNWELDYGGNVVDDDAHLEGLEPHPNLKKLSLENYGGVRLANWLLSLTNLVSLRLGTCKNLTYLPSLSQLPSLNSLTLMELDDLEYIEDSNMVSSSSSTPIAYFPSLKEMQFNRCPKLKGWCRRMDSLETMRVTWMEDYPNLLPSFPLLSKLYIKDCPMLTSMPTFPHLEILKLQDASWKPLQQTMMTNVAALESRSAAIASPALVAASPTPLSKLKSLTLNYIQDLRSLPEEGLRNLTSLHDFSIYSCKRLETLSRSIQHLTALQTLELRYCDELDLGKDDDWMQGQGLKSLRTLAIKGLPKLVSLPEEGLRNLTSLQDLSINSCKRLETLSRGIQHLTALQTLQLRYCNELDLSKDDDWMQGQGLKSLHTLTIEGLPKLVSLPEKGLRSLTSLQDLSINSCKRLETLSRGIQHLTALQTLQLHYCNELDLGKDDDWMQGQGLKSLRTLAIKGLPKLVSLPEKGLRNLTSLQDLSINSCKRLETLSRGIQHLTALQTLELCYCDELDLDKDDDWIQWQGLKSLRTLTISSLPKLVSLPEEGLRNLTSLQDLSINSCERLEMLYGCDELNLGKDDDDDWMQGQGLKSLHTLEIYSLPKLVSLPSGLQHLTTLRAFEIDSCVSLTAVPDWIHKWRSLEEFLIRRCTSLTSLPEGMRRLTSLRNLTIIDCPILLQRCKKDKGKDWPKIAHIPNLKVY